jgi:GNAT superfamily N-acetyltransferase
MAAIPEPRPIIRRVRSEEWPMIRAQRLRALRADPQAFGSTLAREIEFEDDLWRERTTNAARSSTSSQWVAEEPDGGLVGSAVITQYEGNLHIFAMWVEPDRRGRGIGGRLLDAALSWADETFRGRPIYLEVNPAQGLAVRLYESRGFRRTGVTRAIGHTEGVRVEEMVRAPG